MSAKHARPYFSRVAPGLSAALAALLLGIPAVPRVARACGGFFCRQAPINQNAEQIIFRQDGGQVTAIVKILYTGAARDFSWVVPVPGVPTFGLASDLLFNSLEPISRPQFVLDVTGQDCEINRFTAFSDGAAPSAGSAGANPEVEVIETVAVGPFEIQVVRSDDPQALATWLADHGYDLSDRGAALIEPYVLAGMNFVAVRLQQDKTAGDIQPLKMVYQSSHPVIPIRLTAVATQPNLGVIVWVLGPGRAIPLNYLHITPNYAKLNWYQGTFVAYASYQQLITDAMDEAGGQGFATDYAGPSEPIVAQLPDVARMRGELSRLSAIADAADTIAALTNGSVFQPASSQLAALFTRVLPLPAGQSTFVYQNAASMRAVFSASALVTARATILAELSASIIEPFAESLAVFDGNPPMTRLYTTLSAEEMTLDPSFSFNTDLEGQPLERHATLALDCMLGVTHWSLTLGAGTDRDGEVVARGTGQRPFAVPQLLLTQANVKTATQLAESGPGEMRMDNRFATVEINGGTQAPVISCGAGTPCGLAPMAMLFGALVACRRRRR